MNEREKVAERLFNNGVRMFWRNGATWCQFSEETSKSFCEDLANDLETLYTERDKKMREALEKAKITIHALHEGYWGTASTPEIRKQYTQNIDEALEDK